MYSKSAKLSAAKDFRRRSYDDQEGDNDINIILQPSDLDDIEKTQRNDYTNYLNVARVADPIICRTSSIKSANFSIIEQQLQEQEEQEQEQADYGSCTSAQHTYIRTTTSTPFACGRRQNEGGDGDDYDETPSENRRSIAKITAISNNKNLAAKMNLANCLLDQDYNITVQLFIRKSALNWNFNSFTFDALCCGRSLTELLLHLLDYYNLNNIFKLDMIKVLKCCRLLEFGYHSTNPYHNSVHAADVTQAMHCFIQENKIKEHMTHLEILCSIFGAVCHDLDHPGVNQSFLKATNNPLSSLYDNSSVLENHHWRFALCIFKEAKIFDHFTNEMMNEVREQLKHLILATDIARQNEYLKQFRDLTSSTQFSMQNTAHRSLVLQMALKCADLGNPCRPWLISRVWSDLICEEFYRMGRVERELGIPLTPICQRETTCIAGIQADFFRFIVLPLLELWHDFLRSRLSGLLMTNFDQNYKRWQRANGIIQQLRRRKSVACLAPVYGNKIEAAHSYRTASKDCYGQHQSSVDKFISSFNRINFSTVKRASSNYIKSGNSGLELIRDFQLDRIIEKSPLVKRLSRKLANQSAPVHSSVTTPATATSVPKCTDGHNCPPVRGIDPVVSKSGCNIGTSIAAKISGESSEMKVSIIGMHPASSEPTRATSSRVIRENCPSSNISPTNPTTRTTTIAASSRLGAPGGTGDPFICPGYRKVLSPIEDGESAGSPDPNQELSSQHCRQQQQQQQQQQPQTDNRQKPPFSYTARDTFGFAPGTTSTTTTTTTAITTPTTNITNRRCTFDNTTAPASGGALSPNHSHESSTSPSRASSECSSPVMQRSFSSKTPINQTTTPSSNIHSHQQIHQQHITMQQRVQQHTFQSHPFTAQYYNESVGSSNLAKLKAYNITPARQSLSQSKALCSNKRRESDPGCLTDSYGLAAAIVHLIHFQNSSTFHKRRSSLPIYVPKRRSSK